MTNSKTPKLILKEWPSPVLWHAVPPYDFENPTVSPEAIVNILSEAMRAKRGVGMAGPQVNFKYQVFVMGGPYSVEGIFNPEIISQSIETEKAYEGCLSFPGIYVEVERSKHIEVKYQDVNGEWQNFDAVDYDARVFLHEYDHLQGITFNKRVSKMKWDRAKRQSKKEKLINTN